MFIGKIWFLFLTWFSHDFWGPNSHLILQYSSAEPIFIGFCISIPNFVKKCTDWCWDDQRHHIYHYLKHEHFFTHPHHQLPGVDTSGFGECELATPRCYDFLFPLPDGILWCLAEAAEGRRRKQGDCDGDDISHTDKIFPDKQHKWLLLVFYRFYWSLNLIISVDTS